MPNLTDNTVVLHPETGEPVLLAAGPLPDWATDLVGDHLLDGPKPAAAVPSTTATKSQPAESPADELVRLQARINALKAAIGDGGSEGQGDGPPPSDDEDDEGEGGPPPKSGQGSGTPEWRAYADRKGVPVPADASRADIIAALDEARIRTE